MWIKSFWHGNSIYSGIKIRAYEKDLRIESPYLIRFLRYDGNSCFLYLTTVINLKE